jgi:hypothetical protein
LGLPIGSLHALAQATEEKDMTTSRKTRLALFGSGLLLTCGLGYLVNEHLYSPFGIEPTPVPASPLASRVQPAELPPPGGVDVSQVKVGQTYHFQGLRPGVTTVWKIVEITHDAIRYERGRLDHGRYQSDGVFLFPRRDPAPQPGLTKVGQERLEVSGTGFDCQVYEAEGLKSWSAHGFPGTIKTTAGDRVVRALVKIEQS